MSSTPTHNLLVVPPKDEPERDDNKLWPFAGSGWRNRDGSINLVANAAIPEGTRLQLRQRKEADTAKYLPPQS